jgi:hypothetical protein
LQILGVYILCRYYEEKDSSRKDQKVIVLYYPAIIVIASLGPAELVATQVSLKGDLRNDFFQWIQKTRSSYEESMS